MYLALRRMNNVAVWLPWIETEIIDDAPIEAVEAYEKWVEIEKEYQAMGYM